MQEKLSMEIENINTWISNYNKPLVIAGPCSAESENQIIETAKKLDKLPLVKIFRAGIWKPRTRPNSFEGVGDIGLKWLKRVKEETNLKIALEVANKKHVEMALKAGIDILWIGARTTPSPFAVQEIADSLKGVDIPILIKNPVNADLSLWLGAIERIHGAGIKKIAAVHRGFHQENNLKYRNPPLWKIPIELKQHLPNLPILCDPSHITGNSLLIKDIAQEALDIDMEGLMIEVHPHPERAWSDSKQQITFEYLENILKELKYRTEFGNDLIFERQLEILREKIDLVDSHIISCLKQRMEIVKEIGNEKVKKNVTALQRNRMDQLISSRIKEAQEKGLSINYVKDMFNQIHAESVRIQTEMFN